MDDVVLSSRSEKITLQLQETPTLQVLSPDYSPDHSPDLTPRTTKKKLGKRRLKNPAYYKLVPELKRRFTRDRRSEVEVRDIQLLLNRQSGVQDVHRPICTQNSIYFLNNFCCFYVRRFSEPCIDSESWLT